MSLSLSYPFNTIGNYNVSDSQKIGISAGKAVLLLQQEDADFTEDFADDTGFTYDSDLAEFISGLRQKSQIDALSGADFNSDINLEDWSSGIITGTAYNGAAISSGKLDLSGSTNKYVDFDANNNADMQQTGCIKFKWTPKYSGAGSFQYLFSIVEGAGNANNRIRMYHQSTLLFVAISDSAGGSIISFAEAFSPVADTEYEIELNFDITTGETRLFVDGNQLGTTQTGTGTRSSDIGLLRFGKDLNGNGNADFEIDDLIIFDTVQHTANYTKGYTVSDYQYSKTSVIVPEMEHTGDGSIKLFNSFSATYTGDIKILIEIDRSGNKLYWTGTAWAVSTDPYTEATDISVFIANCASLDVTDAKYGQFTIVFTDSNTLGSISELTANLNVDIGYPTDNPWIEPVQAISSIEELINFTETINISGSDAIKYALYKNSNLYYYDGDWIISDGTYAQSNTAAEIIANISSFTTEKIDFNFRAFLHSDDGTTTPELDSVTVVYDFAQKITDPEMCLVYGYSLNPDNTPNTDVIVITLNIGANETLGNNQLSRKAIYITPRDDGYWEKELANTEDMETDSYYEWIYQGRTTKRKVAKQDKQEYNEMATV
jgi:hypothetical protein